MKLRRRVKSTRKAHHHMNKHVLGKSIEDRSMAADERTEIGHWEDDLVKGKRVASEPAPMTLTERISAMKLATKLITITLTLV